MINPSGIDGKAAAVLVIGIIVLVLAALVGRAEGGLIVAALMGLIFKRRALDDKPAPSTPSKVEILEDDLADKKRRLDAELEQIDASSGDDLRDRLDDYEQRRGGGSR